MKIQLEDFEQVGIDLVPMHFWIVLIDFDTSFSSKKIRKNGIA